MWRDRSLWLPLLCGVLFRTILLILWPEESCVRDECSYVRLAERLLDGQGMTPYGGWLWAPGYPSWLALHKAVTGWCSTAKGTQIAVWLLSAVLLYRVSEHLVPKRAAVAGLWLYALSPPLAFFTISLWSETVYTTLFLGALLMLARARQGGWDATAKLAILAGILVLFRGVALYMVPLWLVGLTWGLPWSKALRRGGLFLLLTTATVAPYSLMISRHLGGTVIADRTLGQMMWLGNNTFEPVTFDYGGPLAKNQWHHFQAVGRKPCAPRKQALERDACSTAEGVAWIRENPGHFLMRIPLRVSHMLTPHSLMTRHLRWGGWRGLPPIIEEGFVIMGALVSGLAVVVGSAVLALRGKGPVAATFAAIAVYNVAAIGALAGLSRYRVPLEPILLLFLGWALAHPKETLQRLRITTRGVIAMSVIGVLLPLVLWHFPAAWPTWRTW